MQLNLGRILTPSESSRKGEYLQHPRNLLAMQAIFLYLNQCLHRFMHTNEQLWHVEIFSQYK